MGKTCNILVVPEQCLPIMSNVYVPSRSLFLSSFSYNGLVPVLLVLVVLFSDPTLFTGTLPKYTGAPATEPDPGAGLTA